MLQNLIKDLKGEFFDRSNILTRIIAVNVLVYFLYLAIPVIPSWFGLWEYSKGVSVIGKWLAVPSFLSDFLFKPWTLITYQFMHSSSDIFHLFFNMLYLYVFGRIFLDFIGTKRFLPIYLLGGFGGAIMFWLAMNILPTFQSDQSVPMVGASASIMAISLAITVIRPNYPLMIPFIGAVPIKYIILIFVALDFIQTTGSNAGGHFAHIGGALVGVFFAVQFQKGRDITIWFSDLITLFHREKRAPMKVVHKSNRGSFPGNISQEQELNRILDKINQSGYPSLSQAEKDFLTKTSKK